MTLSKKCWSSVGFCTLNPILWWLNQLGVCRIFFRRCSSVKLWDPQELGVCSETWSFHENIKSDRSRDSGSGAGWEDPSFLWNFKSARSRDTGSGVGWKAPSFHENFKSARSSDTGSFQCTLKPENPSHNISILVSFKKCILTLLAFCTYNKPWPSFVLYYSKGLLHRPIYRSTL